MRDVRTSGLRSVGDEPWSGRWPVLALGILGAISGCSSKQAGTPQPDSSGPDIKADVVLVDSTPSRPDLDNTDHRCNIQLVSATPAGKPGNGWSSWPTVTPDGRAVTFKSWATDLVPDGVNGLYVRDLQTGVTRSAAVDLAGRPVEASCYPRCLTDDTTAVVFLSLSDELVPNDGNQTQDAFRRDLLTGQTVALSVTSSGATANEGAGAVAIAGDGRSVVFISYADDLIPSPVNQTGHVYLRDLENGSTRMVTRRWDGQLCDLASQWPSLSTDGTRLILSSKCALLNLPQSSPPSMAAYVIDLPTGTVQLLSRTPSGNPTMGLQPRLSGDGRRAVYESRIDPGEDHAFTYVNIFVSEVDSGKVTRLTRGFDGSPPNADCYNPALSSNGRYVTFCSRASNLVPDDSNSSVDVFRADLETGALIRVSVGRDAEQHVSRADEDQSAVADDGTVVFSSMHHLLPDWGGSSQVYVYRGCK